jgi:hypothetical protein
MEPPHVVASRVLVSSSVHFVNEPYARQLRDRRGSGQRTKCIMVNCEFVRAGWQRKLLVEDAAQHAAAPANGGRLGQREAAVIRRRELHHTPRPAETLAGVARFGCQPPTSRRSIVALSSPAL